MISYLPTIYDDELVYSWFCRYYVHSGCITSKMALDDILYKRCNNPSKEFLGHLQQSAMEIISKNTPIKELILNHTMFPQYGRFISAQKKQAALYHLEKDFCDVHYLFPILPRITEDKYLKYCPLCVKDDRQKHGECYWHRKHQIRNMRVCTKHRCYLQSSGVVAISNQTFTLCPLEQSMKSMDVLMVEDSNELRYADYLDAVFSEPIDFANSTPIAAVLYNAMLNTPYISKNQSMRNTQRLTDDLNAYYHGMGFEDDIGIYQVQRVLLGQRFDYTTICQMAFFLQISVTQLCHPLMTAQQIKKEQSTHHKHKKANWEVLDAETAPLLERLADGLYHGTASNDGRPQRISEKLVYRELHLYSHSLENMPLCRAIFQQYTETYAENWARRLVWAYRKLKAEKHGTVYWSDLRRLSGVKKKNLGEVLPLLPNYTAEKELYEILAML